MRDSYPHSVTAIRDGSGTDKISCRVQVDGQEKVKKDSTILVTCADLGDK